MIILNLEDPYIPTRIWEDKGFRIMEFTAPQKKRSKIKEITLYAIVGPYTERRLTDIYNLGFGPLDKTGKTIDDKIRLDHEDTGRVMSTVILFGYMFLLDTPGMRIGIDGSDDQRAIFYHSLFKANRNHLEDFFITIGIDWFVKLLRNRVDVEKDENGEPYYKPRPEPFDYKRSRTDLYGYYVLQLKD